MKNTFLPVPAVFINDPTYPVNPRKKLCYIKPGTQDTVQNIGDEPIGEVIRIEEEKVIVSLYGEPESDPISEPEEIPVEPQLEEVKPEQKKDLLCEKCDTQIILVEAGHGLLLPTCKCGSK